MKDEQAKHALLNFIQSKRETNMKNQKLSEPAITFDMHHALNEVQQLCYARAYNAGWHTDLRTGELLERNKGEMLCLVHSEISEAMEGERKNLQDDKLPHRPMAEVELADAIIRIFDYAGRWDYDVVGAMFEKMEYNAKREDHKPENRIKENGKKF